MKSYIENIVGKLDKDAFNLLSEVTTQIEVSKNNFLLVEGEVCKSLWYLNKGAIKSYLINNGEIRNTHFFTEVCFLTNYISVLSKQPSELFFQATEDCQLLQINYAELEKIYSKNHSIEHIGRVMAEMQFINEYNRRNQLLNMDALQRYEFLEENQPEIFSRFALKDIASYLGITPVSLSRLRKYRAEKK